MPSSDDEMKEVTTTLLFGNFDQNGKLENGIFDSSEEKYLSYLAK